MLDISFHTVIINANDVDTSYHLPKTRCVGNNFTRWINFENYRIFCCGQYKNAYQPKCYIRRGDGADSGNCRATSNCRVPQHCREEFRGECVHGRVGHGNHCLGSHHHGDFEELKGGWSGIYWLEEEFEVFIFF